MAAPGDVDCPDNRLAIELVLRALVQFAIAVHIPTDSTSPVHAGFQPSFGGLEQDVPHFLTEFIPYPTLDRMSGFDDAVELTSEAFNGVFPDGVGPDTGNRHVKVGVCMRLNQHRPSPDVPVLSLLR